jgi:HSP20 family molecular chaperone IbpA
MKVTDSNNTNQEYARKLDEKMRNQNAAKEAEIEKTKDLYDKKIESTKLEGEERYASSLKRNDEMIVAASKDYEDKLNGYKENLEHTQKNIALSESALKNEHDVKSNDARLQFMNKYQEQYRNGNETQVAIENDVKSSVESIADRARAQRHHIESSSKAEINALSNDFNQKSASAESDYRSKLEADVKAHEEDIRLQKSDLKELMDKDTEKNQRLGAQKNQVQKSELDYMDKHQKEIMAQKQNDFKARYETLVKEHEAIIANLKTHLNTDMKKIIESSAVKKEMIENKADDKFYRVETLSPLVSETPKDYMVSLKVPEYEKENVHLSVHGREVKMTLARKYSESVEAEDGSSNKSTKNELFSKEFSSQDILNPKLISQKYANGVLSYKISKL